MCFFLEQQNQRGGDLYLVLLLRCNNKLVNKNTGNSNCRNNHSQSTIFSLNLDFTFPFKHLKNQLTILWAFEQVPVLQALVSILVVLLLFLRSIITNKYKQEMSNDCTNNVYLCEAFQITNIVIL